MHDQVILGMLILATVALGRSITKDALRQFAERRRGQALVMLALLLVTLGWMGYMLRYLLDAE